MFCAGGRSPRHGRVSVKSLKKEMNPDKACTDIVPVPTEYPVKPKALDRAFFIGGDSLPPRLEVPAISDLGNSLAEALENIRALLSFGVSLYFTNDSLSSDDKKFTELVRNLDLIAGDKARQASEHILNVRTERSKEGDPVSVSSYGYERVNGEWKVNLSEAKRVKTAFYLASQCACYMDIRDALNRMEEEEGTGVIWNQTRLRYLLLNERYKGDMLTNKTWSWFEDGKRKLQRNQGDREQFYVEDHHEPLVGTETFCLVREAVLEGWLKSNKTAPKGGEVERMMLVGDEDVLLKCVH